MLQQQPQDLFTPIALLTSIVAAVIDWFYKRGGGKRPTKNERLLFGAAVLLCVALVAFLAVGGGQAGALGSLTGFLSVVLFSVWELGRWRVRRKNPVRPAEEFTTEQLLAMRELVGERLQSLEQQRQAIIDQGAREGKTISTEAIFRHLEASKANYQGPDLEAYVSSCDTITRELREQYGDTIPVDEAYKLMKKWE